VVVPAAAATILAPEVERAVRRAVERRTTERLTAQRTEPRATATETTTTMQSHSEATTLGARLATLAATEAVRPVPSVRPATSLETVVLAPRRTIPAAPRVDGPAVQASVATDRTAAVARQTTTTERNATTESTLSRLGRSLIGDRDSTSAGWSGRWGNDQRSGLGGVTSLDAGATGVGEAAEVTSIGGGGETAGARIADRAAAASRSLGAARVVAVERGAQSVEADASLRSTSVTSSRVDTLTEIERREAALASFMQRDVMQRDVMHRDVTHRDALQRDMTVRAAAASSATSASTSTSSSTSTALTSKSASTSQTSTSSRSDTASTEVLASASSDETQSVPRIRRMARADDTVVMLRSRAEDTLVETDASDDESIDDTAFDDGDEASRSERARKRGTDGEMVRTARRRTRTSAERESGPRFYLSSSDDVVAAPSIGPKMAERLKALGVNTVADLLAADAETVAGCLDVRGVKTETVRDWQDQAKLVCDVPGLRGTHAQLLVGAGLRDLFAVADADPATLLVAILRFAQTRDGERVLRSGEPPDLEKITTWVQNAVRAREARAA
jgi:predicted flap endonuclease-1-like 5' DNA nuclease